MRRALLAAVVLIGLAACDTDDEDEGRTPSSADDFTSVCDEHGHRVYLSEDDTQSSPAIFVIPNDCEGSDVR